MKELSISMSLRVVAKSINVIRSLTKKGMFFNYIKTVSNLADDLNLFQDIKSQLITSVKAQMDMCALISGQIRNTESRTDETQSPEYTLDHVEHHAPCTDSATDVCGLLECEACRCSFLFYDQLRQSALMMIASRMYLLIFF